MKVDKSIQKILDAHEKRISYLETLMTRSKDVIPVKERKSLTNHIIGLRERGFFSQPKTAEETHKKLQGSYHCELNRAAVALLRLADRKQLRKATKTINRKEYQAYVW